MAKDLKFIDYLCYNIAENSAGVICQKKGQTAGKRREKKLYANDFSLVWGRK